MEAFILSLNWLRRAGMPEAQFWVLQEDDKRTYSTCDPRGIAYQVYDLAKSMEADFGKRKE
jgi:hypothetical protein